MMQQHHWGQVQLCAVAYILLPPTTTSLAVMEREDGVTSTLLFLLQSQDLK